MVLAKTRQKMYLCVIAPAGSCIYRVKRMKTRRRKAIMNKYDLRNYG